MLDSKNFFECGLFHVALLFLLFGSYVFYEWATSNLFSVRMRATNSA
ncbi:hypothetical protein SAMN04515675_1488 [Pseudomonas costantinii]|uniref:Uncharacterized protein n=1 Tax=Pseudomonas costantinii TaxID=168469 RepID=A0A1H5BGM7_9PSED|nr:hypothetical protein SAMN04515675_1488 [Pseudomonas costantinii]